MNALKNPFLEPGNLPKESDIVVEISRKTWDDMEKASDLLFVLGKSLWDSYKRTNPDKELIEKIEYGLPTEIIDLLRSTDRDVDKKSLRFDYFIDDDGPKLLEIARNPWALLICQRHNQEMADKGAVQFPAEQIYIDLIKSLNKDVKNIGIWKDFDMYEEVEALIKLCKKKKIKAERLSLNDIHKLDSLDALFIDLDTAHFNGELQDLVSYNSFFLPSPANIIFKHKSFLPLAYSIASNKLDFNVDMNSEQKEFLRQFLVPAYFITEDNSAIADKVTEGGVIKDVVGMWGRQVTILHPELACGHGKKARNARNSYRKHLKNAVILENAIFQEYIAPSEIPSFEGLYPEISLVSSGKNYYPFVRIRSRDGVQKREAAGLGSSRIK